MRPETLAAHAEHTIDPPTGAVASPLWLSTTFERAEDGSFPKGFEYIRDDNPNRRQLEECLAALEGGLGAVAGRGPEPGGVLARLRQDGRSR